MTICSWCGGPDNEGLGKCANCVSGMSPTSTKTAPQVTYEAVTTQPRSLLSWIPIKLILYGAVLFGILERERISQYFFKPVAVGAIKLIDAEDGASGAICSTHDTCVIVYVAPWCPSCVDHIDLVRAMITAARNRPGKGVEVIVGMDERPSLEEMAHHFHGRVWLDVNRSFAAAVGVRSIPTLLKVKGGNVVGKLGFPMVAGDSEDDVANKILDYVL